MDVLSFHVTASILALGFDVGLVFPSGGWLTEGGREKEKESLKKKKQGERKRWETESRIPHLFHLKDPQGCREKAYS